MPIGKRKIRTSDGYMLRETIKGLPEAGKKVGGVIGKGVGMAMKAPFGVAKAVSGKILKGLEEKADYKRQKNVESMKKIIEERRKYKK